MTFWIHVLDGRKVKENQQDLSALYKASDALDVLCKEFGVAEVSSFQDQTDLKYNMAAEFGEVEEEEPEPDPETGWSYSIDDMSWFDAEAGLKTFQTLEKQLQSAAGLPSSISKGRKGITADIADCIKELKAAPKGSKFHLAIVM
jgi:hypothetical protein